MSSVEQKIPSLPDDLLLSCLARVSRLYYPTLSFVSKRFRSLLASPELYKARSLLGHTESCLYVCLRFWSTRGFHWFTLCRKPDKTLTKSNGYVLSTVPFPYSRGSLRLGIVAVGSDIYNISESSVLILDCRSNTWRECPNSRLNLWEPSANVIDRKIYVAGTYKDVNYGSLTNSVEVLDTETGIWDYVPIPFNERIHTFHSRSVCIDGKFHLESADNYVVVYDSKECRWDLAGPEIFYPTAFRDSYCEIENVLYSGSFGSISWYDTKARVWEIVKGCVGIPMFACLILADYGGKMAVLWEIVLGNKKMIRCAVIALERRQSCEIWGKVEWVDHVLTVPIGYDIINVLAATV